MSTFILIVHLLKVEIYVGKTISGLCKSRVTLETKTLINVFFLTALDLILLLCTAIRTNAFTSTYVNTPLLQVFNTAAFHVNIILQPGMVNVS